MQIQYASDLHLECQANMDYVTAGGLRAAGDVLVLAGDVGVLSDAARMARFWDWCATRFAATYIVPGNHEWADNETPRAGSWERRLRENVAVCQNRVVRVDDTDLIFSSLWPVPTPAAHDYFHFVMPYFGLKGAPAPDALHRESVAFLFDAVAASTARNTVVVSHFVPMPALLPEHKAIESKAAAFACDLAERIGLEGPDVWLYGHSHANLDAIWGRTRFVTNQLGNLDRRRCAGFAADKCLVLD